MCKRTSDTVDRTWNILKECVRLEAYKSQANAEKMWKSVCSELLETARQMALELNLSK